MSVFCANLRAYASCVHLTTARCTYPLLRVHKLLVLVLRRCLLQRAPTLCIHTVNANSSRLRSARRNWVLLSISMQVLVAVSGKHALVGIVLKVVLKISIELLVHSDDRVLDRPLVTGL